MGQVLDNKRKGKKRKGKKRKKRKEKERKGKQRKGKKRNEKIPDPQNCFGPSLLNKPPKLFRGGRGGGPPPTLISIPHYYSFSLTSPYYICCTSVLVATSNYVAISPSCSTKMDGFFAIHQHCSETTTTRRQWGPIPCHLHLTPWDHSLVPPCCFLELRSPYLLRQSWHWFPKTSLLVDDIQIQQIMLLNIHKIHKMSPTSSNGPCKLYLHIL